jgi:hypothetical protein
MVTRAGKIPSPKLKKKKKRISSTKTLSSWVPVAHPVILAYLGRLRLVGSWFEASLGK